MLRSISESATVFDNMLVNIIAVVKDAKTRAKFCPTFLCYSAGFSTTHVH